MKFSFETNFSIVLHIFFSNYKPNMNSTLVHAEEVAKLDEAVTSEVNGSNWAYLFGRNEPDFLRENEYLADIFEASAQSFPDKPALVFCGESMTYQEVNEKANWVAHYLISQGVVPGKAVGLYVARGFQLLISQLGIAKCGAAWIPLDIDSTPIDRAKVCLEDAKAVGIITTNENFVADEEELPLLKVWKVEDLFRQPEDSLLRQRDRALCLPDYPAYFIYTSGSTGKPKGIEISQRSICQFLRSENSILNVNSDDVVYQGFSVAFDMSFEEIWISYLVGATLWIAEKILASDPERLPNALTQAGVTVINAVPTLISLFTEDIPTVRLINLGGEMCPQALIEKIATPNRLIFNTYGPSEATVSASLAQLQKGEEVTIGTPLPNYGMCVVSEDMKLLTRNETGELCIFGPGLAIGYLGRPDLTSQKFTAPPKELADLNISRIYRTGDLAKIDNTGKIHCLGRVDDQVKIRGFRVELGEIEAALCDQPGIATAAVLLIKAESMDLLVAYCVASVSPHPTFSQLRQALSKRLPNYMIPTRYEWLESMPRLTSGKIDRKALKALPLKEATPEEGGADGSDIPNTFAEKILFSTLKTLLPGQALHFEDNFFADLGGHSLIASQLVSTIRMKFPDKYSALCIQHVYTSKNLKTISDEMSQMEKILPMEDDQVSTPRNPVSYWRKYICGFFQGISVTILCFLQTCVWMVPFFVMDFTAYQVGTSNSVGLALATYIILMFATLILSIIGVRILCFGIEAGKYPLYGQVHFRYWLAQHLVALAPIHLFEDEPLLQQ